MQSSDTALMELFTQQHGLWPKRASEGANSLMRAISNAFYFTDIYCDEIQGRMLEFFVENREKLDINFLELNDQESFDLFLQNPSLPEFEHINLELVSRIFNVKIKFYFIDKGILCGNVMAGSYGKNIKILKLFDNHYESALSIQKRDDYVFAQNLALSIVEAAISENRFLFESHNEGRFINIEYENWKLSSGLTEHENKVLKVDYKQNFYVNFDRTINAVYGSQNNSENQSMINDSSDSVGSIIVSIMERRRKIKAVTRAKRSFERKYDMLINSSDQQSVKVSDSQKNETKNEVIISKPKQENIPPNENLDPEPTMGFQNFSTKIYGSGTNLNKSVSILELNSIFGLSNKIPIGQQTAPFAFSNPTSDLQAKRKKDKIDSMQMQSTNVAQKPEIVNNPRLLPVIKPEISQHIPYPCHEENTLSVLPELQCRQQKVFGLNHSRDTSLGPANKLERANPFNNLDDRILDKVFRFDLHSGKAVEHTTKKSKLKERMRHKRIEEFKVAPLDLSSSRNSLNSPIPQVHNFPFEQCLVHENSQTFAPVLPSQPSPSHSMELVAPSPAPLEDATLPNPKPKYTETRSEQEYTGILKFFDEKNGFGFMTVREPDISYDVFVYRNEFKRAKIPIEVIRQIKSGAVLTFGFHIATYMGKSSECKKAVTLHLIETVLPQELL